MVTKGTPRMATSKAANPFVGRWRITEMELWGREDLELVGPAFIEFDRRGMGEFQFIAVQGGLDCRFTERGGMPSVEFSWGRPGRERGVSWSRVGHSSRREARRPMVFPSGRRFMVRGDEALSRNAERAISTALAGSSRNPLMNPPVLRSRRLRAAQAPRPAAPRPHAAGI